MATPIHVVIDLSHHNERVDFAKVKADGIVGVIHKATQGSTYLEASRHPTPACPTAFLGLLNTMVPSRSGYRRRSRHGRSGSTPTTSTALPRIASTALAFATEANSKDRFLSSRDSGA